MRQRGWHSTATLNEAIKDLLMHQFIVKTRYGGLNKASLYAVTFLPIDWVSNDGYSNARVANIPTHSWKLATSISEAENP